VYHPGVSSETVTYLGHDGGKRGKEKKKKRKGRRRKQKNTTSARKIDRSPRAELVAHAFIELGRAKRRRKGGEKKKK